jgi:DNA-binding XRE family transcriptional regulator
MAEGEKHPGGRPSTYDPAYCERVVELGREGMSPAEIAAEIGVPRTTMISWAKAHPEFSTALSHAKDFELAWWEKQARTGLAQQGFNAGLWKHAVSGRFPHEPYRERQEVSGLNGGPQEHVHRIERAIVRPSDTDR